MKYILDGGVVQSHEFSEAWYPRAPARRALVDQWLDWKHCNLRAGAAGVARLKVMSRFLPSQMISNNSWAKDVEEIPVSWLERKLENALTVLDDELACHDYLGGFFRGRRLQIYRAYARSYSSSFWTLLVNL